MQTNYFKYFIKELRIITMVKAVLLSFNIITKGTTTIFIFLSLSIVTFAMISSNSGGYELLFIVFAQMEKDKDTNQKMVDTQSVNSIARLFLS